MLFGKKRRERERLLKVRQEWEDNAAWHYAQGNYLGCVQCTMIAANYNQKLIKGRRR